MSRDQWPKVLTSARGPMRADKLDGAVLGMGDWGEATNRLAAEGFVPPDMMTGLTLFILSNQPRRAESEKKMPGGGGGVAGGVWVRERFVIHRPLPRDEAFNVEGESVGRHVHKGRRYGTNVSRTFTSSGERVAENLTTGLLAYQVDEALSDQVEGQPVESLSAPGPNFDAAAANPCLEALRSVPLDEVLGGLPLTVSLAMMAARDTAKPDNPIHSDPELAKKAGLSRPIAGGSHVLAFALEPIMARAGHHALLHGAYFDVRWKAPVYADTVVTPRAVLRERSDRLLTFEVSVELEEGATAMVGQVQVPLA